jgi:putative ABC transport system substrate-binding protein
MKALTTGPAPTPSIATALLAAMSLLSHAAAGAEPVHPPPVPGNIRIPEGNEPFLVGHAYGTQNYSCLPAGVDAAGNPRYAWTLFTPQATLYAHNLKEITTHYFSPNPYEPSPGPLMDGPIRATWQDSKDTSTVWGKVVPGDASSDSAYVAPGAIPWLRITVVGTEDGPTGGKNAHAHNLAPSGQHLRRRRAVGRLRVIGGRRQAGIRALHGRLLLLPESEGWAEGRLAPTIGTAAMPVFLRATIVLAIALAAAPVAAQAPKVLRIGYLAAVSLSADTPRLQAFRQGLRELGYVEGRDVIIDYRHEDRSLDRLPALAAELVAMKPDVLVGVTTNAALAVKEAAGTLPVVFMGVTDPVSAGLVASLGHPGGNATGVTNMAAVLTGKRLEYLKATLPPGMTHIAVLWDPQAPGSVPQWEESKEHAKALGLTLYSMEVSRNEQYEEAFGRAVAAQNGAVWVTLNPLANSNQLRIAELAARYRLPSVCARGDYAENGCLMSYGPGYSLEGRDGARYVDKILKGDKPQNLPVEQPTRFELVVNQKTAKRLGVSVPQEILMRADRVVE